MGLKTFRQSRGLSLAECAEQLGLRSRGQIHDIESGRQKPSIKLALRIERWSGGEVKASELCPDVADLLPPIEPAEARA